MKNKNTKTFIGAALVIIAFAAVIISAVWALVFHFMNPDMTELRLFIENPYPSIITIISLVVLLVGKSLMEAD